MEYHLSIAGERSGPHSQFKIIDQIREGVLKGDELVWRMGVPGWVPLRELDDFTSYWPPTSEELVLADAARQRARLELDRPRPWMRFWARMVDYFWFTFSLGMLVSAVLPAGALRWLMEATALQLVFNALTLLAFAPVEAWFLSRRGTTPGKALLRIQVRTKDGTLPTYRQALLRALRVWMMGMGFGIQQILALATMAWWRIRLLQKGTTAWDESSHTRVEHGQPEPWRLVVLGGLVALLALVMVLAVLLSQEFQEAMRSLPK